MRLLSLGFALVLVDEDERERFGGEVAAADEPFVVMFDQQRAGEPDPATPSLESGHIRCRSAQVRRFGRIAPADDDSRRRRKEAAPTLHGRIQR